MTRTKTHFKIFQWIILNIFPSIHIVYNRTAREMLPSSSSPRLWFNKYNFEAPEGRRLFKIPRSRNSSFVVRNKKVVHFRKEITNLLRCQTKRKKPIHISLVYILLIFNFDFDHTRHTSRTIYLFQTIHVYMRLFVCGFN